MNVQVGFGVLDPVDQRCFGPCYVVGQVKNAVDERRRGVVVSRYVEQVERWS